MKRINPLTSISDIEVENKINILNKQFHFPIKDSIVKNIFNQTDSTSTIELYTLADAIENCNKISSNWVEKHIKLIERDANNAYGSLWEIIFGGILIDSGVNVILEKDSNPGIDVSANIWNTDFHFSLKRYESSTHYNNLGLFFDKLKPIIEKFKEEITNIIIYLQNYPDSTTLSNIEKKLREELRKSNQSNTNTYSINEPGKFSITINHNINQYNEINRTHKCSSFNIILVSELHKNEKKNLFDKITDAIDNLIDHKKNGINIIGIHLNQFSPIDAIEKFINEYFQTHQTSKIDGIILYQPNIFINSSMNNITHVIRFIKNPKSTMPNPNGQIPVIKVTTGNISMQSIPNVINISPTLILPLTEKYYFQYGKIYTDMKDENGKKSGNCFKIGPNISVIPTLQENGKILAIEGKFSKTDRLFLI